MTDDYLKKMPRLGDIVCTKPRLIVTLILLATPAGGGALDYSPDR